MTFDDESAVQIHCTSSEPSISRIRSSANPTASSPFILDSLKKSSHQLPQGNRGKSWAILNASRYPKNLVTTSPAFNLADSAKVLIAFFWDQRSLTIISRAPLIHAPHQGRTAMFDYLNSRLIVIGRIYGHYRWDDNCSLLPATINIPDDDGLTAFAQLYQLANPRGHLAYRTRAELLGRNGVTARRVFLGYNADLIRYEIDFVATTQLQT